MKFRRDKGRRELMGSEPTTRVWLNGTFDVLHYGHIHLFQTARNLYPNTIVRVGLDTDERIRQMVIKLLDISEAITVRIKHLRIGSQCKFLLVAQAISVGVE